MSGDFGHSQRDRSCGVMWSPTGVRTGPYIFHFINNDEVTKIVQFVLI